MQVINDDCRNTMRAMDANSISAIVTDPPYGLKFMGKGWDHSVPGVEFWQEALRVAKPGCHLLAFGGTRTYHRLACAIEDAGWEIRDSLMWVYGSGFPKGHDVSKAIDKEAGAEREVIGSKRVKDIRRNVAEDIAMGKTDRQSKFAPGSPSIAINCNITAPSTDDAKKWEGWNIALKPAYEPIILARKPLAGTVAGNVLEHGTGAVNIDACRVGRDLGDVSGWSRSGSNASENRAMSGPNYARNPKPDSEGRWPANFIYDGSDEVTDLLGSAARFFYCAKASPSERGEHNTHATVKPLALMRYLIKLITPPNGIVLDPFAGSGSTLVAASQLGFDAIGIELDKVHCDIIERRLKDLQGVLAE